MNGISWVTRAEASRVLQTGPTVTRWRSRNTWSPLTHSSLEFTTPTMTLHTLQHVYPALIRCLGVVSDSVHAALQQICPITIIIITHLGMIAQRIHARSLISRGIPPMMGRNKEMLQTTGMDQGPSVWPLPEM